VDSIVPPRFSHGHSPTLNTPIILFIFIIQCLCLLELDNARIFCSVCSLFYMQVLLGFDLQINLALSEQLNGIFFILCVNVNFRSNKNLIVLIFCLKAKSKDL